MSYGHDKVALLTRKHSEYGTRNHMQRFEADIYTKLIKT